MRKTNHSFIIGIILIAALTSCKQNLRNHDDQDPTAYKAPVTSSFEFTAPEPIEWEIVDPEDIPPPRTYPLDMDKMPSKPFSINEFKPLRSTIKEYPLDWDVQEQNPLRYDTMQVKLKTSILPKPVVSKMNRPQILNDVTSGLLQLSTSEGLPSNEIRRVIQNEDGTYWIATFDGGICLYNGNDLYTYNYTNIWDIELDQDGKLWVATGNNGVYVLDFKQKIQTHFLPYTTILDLYCDHQNQIWMVHWRKGTYIVDSEIRHFRKITNTGFDYPTEIKEDHDQNIWVGHSGTGKDEIYLIGKDRASYSIIYDGIQEVNHFDWGRPHVFFLDHKNRMWVSETSESSESGAMAISLANKTVSTLGDKQGFYGMAKLYEEDDQGRLWIIKNDTIQVLSKDRRQMKVIVTNSPVKLPLKIGCAMKDERGVIWIGTLGKGVILVDTEGPLSEHLDESNGLANSEIWSLEEDHRGDIWIGSLNGVDIYSPSKGTIKTIDHSTLKNPGISRIPFIKEFETDKVFVDGINGFNIIDRSEKIMTRFIEDEKIAKRVFEALKDKNGTYWLATLDGLTVYNPELNSLKLIRETSLQLDCSRVINIVEDGSGHYWLGTDNGLAIIDPEKNTIRHLREKEGLCNNNIMKVMLSKEGEIWVATTDGLSIIDPVNQTITNVGEEEGLVPDELYELREKEGTFYIGSVNGLIQVKPATDKNKPWIFYKHAEAQGFPSSDYKRNSGLVRNNGQLWLGSSPMHKLTILTQDPVIDTAPCAVTITGLVIMNENPSFERMSGFQSWFETGDTLWSGDGNQPLTKNTLPRDSGYVFEHNIHWDSLSLLYSIPMGLKLPYDQNSLKFNFASICVLNRDKIHFRYILKGEDETWIYNKDISNSKTYFNLSPGKYSFKVESEGVNGKWGAPAEFNFTILPPWWQTWWAYGIYGLLFIVGVLIADRFQKQRLIRIERAKAQVRELAQAKEIEKAYHELKTTQSQLIQSEKMASLGELTAGIAHEIQNPLNFVNNFSEVNRELIAELREELENGNLEEVKEIAGDLEQNEIKISHHGKRADDIVKGMLQHSRTSSGQKEPTDLNALADEYLRLSYHGLRAKDKSFNADFKLEADPNLPEINVVPQDIGRVLLNLINNAFYAVSEKAKQEKDEYKPAVVVSSKKLNDKIEIRVKDNGNGIPESVMDKIFQPFFTTKPTGQGTGLGLSMSYDIITKGHGGELIVSSELSKGSEFIIRLPL
ncbi:MAG: hypothetical protein KQI35_01510 [Bacteroidetes bacterium]|nr:hypothetical protein [Bacteroidota bacterium]